MEKLEVVPDTNWQGNNSNILKVVLMKKILFIVVGLCMCFPCFSQLSQTKKNEVKLDFFMTVMNYPTISYERFFGKHIGTGLSVGFPLKGDETNRFLILPYGRFYFGNMVRKVETRTGAFGENYLDEFYVLTNEYSGFFIEVNTGFFGREELNEMTWRYHNTTKFGLGAAIGWKILGSDSYNKLGDRYFGDARILELFTYEIFFGLGWGVDDFKVTYPRFGINIGIPF
ncbi:MAG: hypothetical protein LBI15_02975 [Dysgonamonadaceae bacterium]|nr:hypothetical protein [Dysgonamonadaceae bacterium]